MISIAFPDFDARLIDPLSIATRINVPVSKAKAANRWRLFN